MYTACFVINNDLFATVDVCEGSINISLLIGLYFPPNWVLQVLLPLVCLSSYGFPGCVSALVHG